MGHGWNGYVAEYEISCPIADGDFAVAVEIAEAALAPASERDIVRELGRLRALTVSRDIGQDLGLVFAAYTEEFRRHGYPIDVIREVLREWRGTFWPSMGELRDRMDPLLRPRQTLRDALRRGYQPPVTSPDCVPRPTEEQKAEVAALLAKHGIAVDQYGRLRPPEREPMTKERAAALRAELAAFRLPGEDDPRVQKRLRDMRADEPAQEDA